MISDLIEEQVRIARNNRRALVVLLVLWLGSLVAVRYAGRISGRALSAASDRPGILSVPWVYEGVQDNGGVPAHHSQVGVAELWTPVSEGSYAEHLRLVARFRSTQVVRN